MCKYVGTKLKKKICVFIQNIMASDIQEITNVDTTPDLGMMKKLTGGNRILERDLLTKKIRDNSYQGSFRGDEQSLIRKEYEFVNPIDLGIFLKTFFNIDDVGVIELPAGHGKTHTSIVYASENYKTILICTYALYELCEARNKIKTLYGDDANILEIFGKNRKLTTNEIIEKMKSIEQQNNNPIFVLAILAGCNSLENVSFDIKIMDRCVLLIRHNENGAYESEQYKTFNRIPSNKTLYLTDLSYKPKSLSREYGQMTGIVNKYMLKESKEEIRKIYYKKYHEMFGLSIVQCFHERTTRGINEVD